jgi:hypothetical protein
VDLPAWIPITVAAALFQAWRTALQANLRHDLSASGAAFVRYLYALPLDLLLLGMAWWFFQPSAGGLSPELILGLARFLGLFSDFGIWSP